MEIALDTIVSFLARLAATATLVLIVARVAERAGPFLASTVLTLPLFAGPSYFFLMDEVSPEFLAASSLYAFAGTGAVLAFTAGVIISAERFGLWRAWAIGVLFWGGVATPMQWVELSVPVAFGWCGVGIAIAIVLRKSANLHLRPSKGTAEWGTLIARAMVAGIAVASVSALGATLGPRLTGVLVTFPLTLTVSMWMIYRQYGAAFMVAMLISTQRTLPSYASFCLVFAWLATRLDSIQAAFWLALEASLLCAMVIAYRGSRRRQ